MVAKSPVGLQSETGSGKNSNLHSWSRPMRTKGVYSLPFSKQKINVD
jgi:hypothetical protein